MTSRKDFIKLGTMAAGMPLVFGGCRSFRGNSKINVAIIGCGRISNSFEIPGVLKRKDIARLVAVCDLDSKRAAYSKAKIEQAYNDGAKIRVYKGYKELEPCKGTGPD